MKEKRESSSSLQKSQSTPVRDSSARN